MRTLRLLNNRFRVYVVVLLGVFITTQVVFAQPLVAKAGDLYTNKMLLDVSINKQDTHKVILFLQNTSGKLLVKRQDLESWHVRLPANLESIPYEQDSYYSLDALPGVSYVINKGQMVVDINIPGKLFSGQAFSALQGDMTMATKPPLGGFLNYDLLAQKTNTKTHDDINSSSGNSSQVGGLFTANVFNKYGVGSTDFVLQHNDDGTADDLSSTNANKSVRLNSAWTIDSPERMRTCRFGDGFSTPGMWGKSVDFGGVHWGTNFATQPRFINFPLPSTSGVATLPSSVDLYVNNSLVNKKDIAAGPFDINTIPVITGAGTLNVVTTDLLGRQQTVSMPYYASNTLLKKGLHDFAYDAGFLRENYGVNSNDYGTFAALVNDRLGLTDNFTGEWRAEFMRDQQALGLGGNYLLSTLGVFNAAVAASNSNTMHAGQYGVLGFQRQEVIAHLACQFE